MLFSSVVSSPSPTSVAPVAANPFFGSQLYDADLLVTDEQYVQIQEAIAKAFTVPDDHFAQLGRKIGLDPHQIISLGDWGLIGDSEIFKNESGLFLTTQINLTTSGCPSKVSMKQAVQRMLEQCLPESLHLSVRVIDQFEALASKVYRHDQPKLAEILGKLNGSKVLESEAAYREIRADACYNKAKNILKDSAASEDRQKAVIDLAFLDVRTKFEWAPTWIPESTIIKAQPYIDAVNSQRISATPFIVEYVIPAIEVAKSFYAKRKSGEFLGLDSTDEPIFDQALRDAFVWATTDYKSRLPSQLNPNPFEAEAFDSQVRQELI